MSDRVQVAAAQSQATVCEPVPKQSIALGAFLLCSGIGFLLYAVLHFTGHIDGKHAGAVSDRTSQPNVRPKPSPFSGRSSSSMPAGVGLHCADDLNADAGYVFKCAASMRPLRRDTEKQCFLSRILRFNNCYRKLVEVARLQL